MKKALTFLFLLISLGTQARISLPAVISNNMVLQQQSNVKLWGWGNPTEKISITNSWNNKTDTTTVTRDANWQVSLQTPKAGGPYTITLKGENTIILTNILIGEVWVCSGQSNMEFNFYWGLPDIKAELPTAKNPNIRFFQIPRTTAKNPQDDVRAGWAECDSNTLKSFSGVGYFFGKKLNKDLKVPIGLINASWGGTPAEVWTPAEVVNTDDTLKQAASTLKLYPGWPITPGATYNGMISPLTNFSIAGAIWYQGEGNTSAPNTYNKLFSTMITSWRAAWNTQFPFYFVQIAPFKYGGKFSAALLREQQAKTLNLPKVGMVSVSDLVDDVNDIHPKNKHDVGLRLANLAEQETYGRKGMNAKSPSYAAYSTANGKITVGFQNAETGLTSKGVITEVEIAGDDKRFVPAQAKIVKNKLVVWSNEVKAPASVRYAFRNDAIGNLFGKNGLPVAPFRTDNWDITE